MCKDCFEKQYYGFSSQNEFKKFEEILDIKCKTKKIIILKSKNEDESGVIDFRMYYQCNNCKEKFVMSIPENSWRGYLLTEMNAIEYHQKIKESDKNKQSGCLIIIVLIILSTLYSMTK